MVGQSDRSKTSSPGTVGVCPLIKSVKISSKLPSFPAPPMSDNALLPIAGFGFIAATATYLNGVEGLK